MGTSGVTFTQRETSHHDTIGPVVSCSLRVGGVYIGHMWKMNGRWSSAYSQDGGWSSRDALVVRMLARYIAKS